MIHDFTISRSVLFFFGVRALDALSHDTLLLYIASLHLSISHPQQIQALKMQGFLLIGGNLVLQGHGLRWFILHILFYPLSLQALLTTHPLTASQFPLLPQSKENNANNHVF